MRRRILWSMVGITAVAVLVFAVPLGVGAGHLYRSREVTRLEREATRAAGRLPATGLHGADAVDLPATTAHTRLAVYDASGKLVAGREPPAAGSEVRAALQGRVGEDREGSWLAVAVPMNDEETVVGAARAAIPWSQVTSRVWLTYLAMAILGVAAIAVAAGLAQWQARRLAAPIADVAAAADRLGHGDFLARLDPYGIAEIDVAANALNVTASRLDDLVARERAFSADASHQLRTPLTSLRLSLERGLSPGGDRSAALQEAIGEVDRLQRTVATLLALARATPTSAEFCDVATVCHEVAARWNGILAAHGRPMRVDVQPGLPPVACSEAALAEVLQILVDNAVTHGRGEVTIVGRHVGPGVVVHVEDEGSGIVTDGDDLFQRGAAAGGGHGIGLALARSLAEAYGGRVRLRSANPHTVFTVALRTHEADEDLSR